MVVDLPRYSPRKLSRHSLQYFGGVPTQQPPGRTHSPFTRRHAALVRLPFVLRPRSFADVAGVFGAFSATTRFRGALQNVHPRIQQRHRPQHRLRPQAILLQRAPHLRLRLHLVIYSCR